MRNIGVEMIVTPLVEANDKFSFQLEPKVIEFEGFAEYGGCCLSSNTTVTVLSGFYQPIFSTHECIQNILNEAIFVMDGLTREEVKKVKDKVPILSDIQLIGRLFSSKIQRQET
jgi:general secretion pathway protein D